MEAVLQWGNASVLSPGVVTRRLGSCPRPEDWDLGKSDANRALAMRGTTVLLPFHNVAKPIMMLVGSRCTPTTEI